MWRTSPLTLLAFALLSGCSGGSGGGSGEAASDFKVLSINVQAGATWKINRPLEITFSQDVDLSTVNLNTVRVTDIEGGSATGEFVLAVRATGQVDPRTVRFRPNCPVLEDYSDAGLVPGTTYQLRVMGSASKGAVTVRSTSGEQLVQGKLVTFQTPDSDKAYDLFVDQVQGPPAVRLRGAGVDEDDLDATHLELGGERVYFTLDTGVQQGRLPSGFKVPLNHYSIPENQVSVVVVFNQAVDGSSTNLSQDRIRLEYLDGGTWEPVATRIELLANCTEVGASVRLSPNGILPQGSELRVALRVGFADLTGDALGIDVDFFARMDSAVPGDENPLFPGIGNPEVDTILDGFVGDELFDESAAFEVPPASWGGGELRASFDFDGTGGPDGTFDWYLPDGAEFILDTSGDTIVGGPDGVPTTTQAVINGVVDIRDLFIPETSRLIIVGPYTCTILAAGDVRILGEISVRGSDNPGVGTLNTTNQPEQGAAGQAGGGDGGTGSYLTTQSTPRGGPGEGAFGLPGFGGQGGETSFSTIGTQARRGAGGGGGSLGPDVYYDHDGSAGTQKVRCQTLIGLDVEYGASGGAEGTGAESQSERAKGGNPGPYPFFDIEEDNNFFGSMLRSDGSLVQGELDRVWAGAGGGGGGDASASDYFPPVPFDPTGDEKGAGGGGGAGGLRILAIGPIQIGDETWTGRVVADGGDGGGGENSFSRIGGGSGGGSGGHIVLSSAAEILVYGKASTAEPWYTDNPNQNYHAPRMLSAVGGQGGAGNFGKGGSSFGVQLPWLCDYIPFPYFEGLTGVPPSDAVCYKAQPDYDDPDGPSLSAGGDGSPGIIQLHVDDPATRLRFPTIEAEQGLTYGTGLDVTPVSAPPPLGWFEPGEAVDALVPFFGRLSRAQSKWIPLGLARFDPGGPDDQVELRFEGLDSGVPNDGGSVEQLAPILGPDDVGGPGAPPFITDAGYTMVFDPAALAPENLVYLDNPELLREFTVELSDSAGSGLQRFEITGATFDTPTGLLSCRVDPNGPKLTSFEASGVERAAIRPHFFRVITDGIADAYPSNSQVRILFDATVSDSLTGAPRDEASYSASAGSLTEDVSLLNADTWDWLRFQVEFDLDKSGSGVDQNTPRPGLDHLGLQFRF